ncbi:MAG: polysaccharide deacetylase family protein [Planctomycetes bacterium]|nr:polysaccharide deacetylase family protein [Planctomycetota bacterium]
MRVYMLKGIKDLLELMCAALYAPLLFLMHKKPLHTVIYYHGVKKADIPSFSKQMAYLANKCSVVKLSKMKNMPSDKDRILTAITFDDAFVSVLENAVPVLKKYKLPAAIFVPTGNLGKTPLWALKDGCSDAKEIVMTEQQIVELDKAGFEIFSHTISHPLLTEIEHDMLIYELKDSKQALERILSREVRAVSYPHGAYNSNVCEAAKEVGYKQAFTIQPFAVDESTDDMRIGRFVVSPKDGLLKFRLKVSGAYQVVQYLQMLKKMLIPA